MYLDAHTHLAKYNDEVEIDSALQEIVMHNILTISNSMDAFAYEKNLRIAERNHLVIPTFGVHPWTATEYSHKLDTIVQYMNQSPILGEIGLDFHFVEDKGKYRSQLQVFEFFLDAAREKNKITIIHTRGAEVEVLKHIKDYRIQRPIIHWYSGSMKLVNKFLDAGCYFTIGVEILISKKIQKLAKFLPEERILTETDNPGGYYWLKNEQGMPSLIIKVLNKLAAVREDKIESLSKTILKNFYSLIKNDAYLPDEIKKIVRAGMN